MSQVSLARGRGLLGAVLVVMLVAAVWVTHRDRAQAEVPPAEGIDVVYVAVGTNFPDSLGAGPGGGINGAPIIIVPTDPPIPAATSGELVRLDPKKLVLVGGTAVISASMEGALGALLPNAVVERIAGSNRYETNAMFSEATFPIEGWASIPAPAFTPTNPDSDNAAIFFNAALNATNGVLVAPIQLPHGAEILELQASGIDNNGAQELTVTLARVDNGPSSLTIATVESSGSPGNFTVSSTSITAGTEVVDNENHGYAVLVSNADGSLLVRNVMARYRIGAPGA